MSIIKKGLVRLTLYLTLSTNSFQDKILVLFAGLLNVLLAIPSLKSMWVAKLYNSMSKRIVGKCVISFLGYNVKSPDCAGMIVFSHGYEPLITKLLLRLLKQGDIFVDVGAHAGRYALLTSHKVGSKGLVIALEPIPDVYTTLLENIRTNNIINIRTIPVAAWNKDDIHIEMLMPPGRGSATAKELHHFSGLKLAGTKMMVKAITLDTLLSKILEVPRVIAIKIDVEGAEVEVLQGAKDTLRTFKPKLIIEVHSKTYQAIKHILEDQDYQISMIDGSSILAVPNHE